MRAAMFHSMPTFSNLDKPHLRRPWVLTLVFHALWRDKYRSYWSSGLKGSAVYFVSNVKIFDIIPNCRKHTFWEGDVHFLFGNLIDRATVGL